jgi:quercetin 2,3-dioxygenase
MEINKLPGSQVPFLLEAGEGHRYAFGDHLATIIARKEDMGISMAGAVLTGAKGAAFPPHRHAISHEALFVVEGVIELMLGECTYELSPGDYVNIPPGTPHGFSYKDHRGRVIAWTFLGDANLLYSVVGKSYAGTVYPESPKPVDWAQANASVDTEILPDKKGRAQSFAVKLSSAPSSLRPFVLANGEGERMLAADQLYTICGSEYVSNGVFLSLLTEGPVGPAIPKHLHKEVSETFFCLNGAMEMFAGTQFVTLHPGDFLHIPPGTPHSFRLLKHDTRFIGFLSPGNFATFFRYLCDPYEAYIYPLVPLPFRFDRVIKHLPELDLTILERPAGAPPQ